MDHLDKLLAWIDSPHGSARVATLRGSPDRPDGWATTPYTQLAASVRAVAAGLRERQLGAGDRVCIICAAGPEFIAGIYGTWWGGGCAVSLPLPVLYEEPGRYWGRIESMIRAASPKVVLVSSARLADPRSTPLAQIARDAGASVITLEEALAMGRDGWPGRTQGTETAMIQFTSGSGGPPKAVRITAENLSANISGILRWLGVTAADRVATWLPHYHDMGLTGCTLAPVTVQAGLLVLRPEQFIRDPAAWLSCLGRHGATMTSSPNFGYAYATTRVQAPRLRGMDFSGLRAAVVGAERVDPRAITAFASALEPFGFRAESIFPAYGLAEATLAVTGKRSGDTLSALAVDWATAGRLHAVPIMAEHAAIDFGDEQGQSWTVSCGRPLDGVDVTIVDDDHSELPEGTLGEIAVSGVSVSPGYLDTEHDSVFTSFANGRLFTGDDGFLWKGQLYLVGRRGDGLKVAGRSLYSEQLEAEFAAAAGLSPSRCTALLGVHAGAELAAVVVEAPPGEWIPAGSVALSRMTGGIGHAIYAAPRGTILRTTSGKPVRKEAWRRLTAGQLLAQCVHQEQK